MAAFDLFGVGHTLPVERAARQFVAVTRNMNVIEVQREAQQRQQLAGEYDRPAHHRQQQRIFAAQIARDFVGYPLQRGAALVLVEQQFGAVEHGLGVSAFGC